jgi:adenosine deaminase CECR1
MKNRNLIISLTIVIGLIIGCKTTKQPSVSSIINEGEFNSIQKYFQNRSNLINAEREIQFDADPDLLDTSEIIANDFFIELKKREVKRMVEKDKFPPSSYFLDIKSFIDQSPFYLTIQNIPKGAMLYGHIHTMGNYRSLLNKAGQLPNCYVYIGADNKSWVNGTFRFAPKSPGKQWRSFQQMRELMGDEFMYEMYDNISLGRDDYPFEHIPREYDKALFRADGLLSYKPLFRDFVLSMFKDLVKDNVSYVEIHSSFNGMYDLQRSYFNPFTELDLYVSARNEIQKEYPDFDFKVIYSVGQSQKRKSLLEHYETALLLVEKYPEIMGGFDFASIEYTVNEFKLFLKKYMEVQEKPNSAKAGIGLFFNPDESDKTMDDHIYDAVLLECKRIGYGYELTKFPLLMNLIKEKGLAIEISPISNQVLGYSANLSDHPGKIFLNHGLPVVLGSENQGIMKFSFSHQFYEAAIAWDLDLAGIKQLILNSIRYSNQPIWKKQIMEDLWRSRWKKFIKQLVQRSKIEVVEY